MRFIGNVLSLILGGLDLAIGYAVAGIVMFVLIVTIPFGIQAFKLASYSLWPFGRVVVRRADAGTVLSLIGNVIWFVLAGFWIAIGHLFMALLLTITIIGIPFAIAHLKLARISLWPFGYTIVMASAADPSSVVVGVQPLGADVT
jgi:uncharacterized membrane protein YccF (DUF307 family)